MQLNWPEGHFDTGMQLKAPGHVHLNHCVEAREDQAHMRHRRGDHGHARATQSFLLALQKAWDDAPPPPLAAARTAKTLRIQLPHSVSSEGNAPVVPHDTGRVPAARRSC